MFASEKNQSISNELTNFYMIEELALNVTFACLFVCLFNVGMTRLHQIDLQFNRPNLGSNIILFNGPTNSLYLSIALCEKCPYSELLWSVFSRIRTEYSQLEFSSNWENADHIQSEYGKMQNKTTSNTDTFCAVLTMIITKLQVFSTMAQKMAFSIKDFFSKCEQIRRKLE